MGGTKGTVRREISAVKEKNPLQDTTEISLYYGRMRGIIAALLVCSPALASADGLLGPTPARVLRVVDGDTLLVSAHVWLGQRVVTRVRIAGIDAPELRGRCERESEIAQQAKAQLEALTRGVSVTLSQISADKYGGRVLADVAAGGRDVGRALIDAGLARPYYGGKRAPWC